MLPPLIVVLHVLSVILLIAGVIGRDVCYTQAGRTSDLAALLPDLRVASGVVVAGASGEAVPGSDGQLNAGDVIHAVNGRAVRSLPDLRAAGRRPASGFPFAVVV